MRLGMGLGLGNLLSGQPLTGFPNDFSFNFDGSNDYLEIADNDALSFGDGSSDSPFSISAWINPVDSTQFQILGKLTEWQLYLGSDDKLILFLQGATGSDYEYASDSGSAIPQNVWTHVACTYSGVGGTSANAGIKLYVNGVESSLTLGGAGTYDAMENTTNPVRIGNYSSQYADGKIDEVAVWSVALSASDVAKIASKPVDFSKASTYATDRTSNLKLWLRAGDKVLPESDASIARSDFYTDFDGTDDHLDIDTTVITGTNDFTITAWANNTTHGGTYKGVVSIGSTAHNGSVYLGIVPTNQWGYGTYGAINQSISETTVIGQWEHLAVVRNGSDIKMYFRGILKHSQSVGGLDIADVGTFIGRIANNNSYPFNGKISNVGIYQTALDAQTIKQFAKSRFTPMRDNRFSVVDFDGTNDYISISSTSFTGTFTMSSWVNVDDISSGRPIVGDTGNDNWFKIVDADTAGIRIAGGTATEWDAGMTFSTGSWAYIAVVRNSSNEIIVYVNGVAYTSNQPTLSGTYVINALGQKGNGQYWDGAISSVSLYNVAKSADEIYAIYQQGITYDESSLSGLQGYWRMGDDTSKAYPTIADSSSNSNDGTITNGASDDIVQQMVAGYDMGAFESSSEELSGELITNGDFSSATGWTDASNLISNGVAHFYTTGSEVYIEQTDKTIIGRRYILEYDITEYTSGTIKTRYSPSITLSTSVASHTTTFVAEGTVFGLKRGSGSGTTDIKIDNVSLKEVLQSEVSDTYPAIIDVNEPVLGVELVDNTTASQWLAYGSNPVADITNGVKITYNNDADGARAMFSDAKILNTDLTVGKLYKVTFNAYYEGGSAGVLVRIYDSTAVVYRTPSLTTSDTSYTLYFKATHATNAQLYLQDLASSNIVYITNISTKELQGHVGTMTNQASSDLVYSSVLPDQSFLTGVNSAYNFISLDGSNEYIDCGANVHDFSSGDFSCVSWIYHDQANSNNATIFGIKDSTNTELLFYVHNSTEKLTSWNGSTDVASSSTISDEVWTHVAMVQDGSDKKFYINGVLDATASQSNGTARPPSLLIGYSGNGSEYFKGNIAQSAVYNKALSATEVGAIYTLGRHGNLLDSYSDNLKGYWAMSALDASTGLSDSISTVYDRSGNSNHGTPQNADAGDLASSPNAEPNGYAKQDSNRTTTTP